MSTRVSAAPIKQSIVVEAPIERAFKVFTEDFGSSSLASTICSPSPSQKPCSSLGSGVTFMTEVSMAANAAGRVCWLLSRPIACF